MRLSQRPTVSTGSEMIAGNEVQLRGSASSSRRRVLHLASLIVVFLPVYLAVAFVERLGAAAVGGVAVGWLLATGMLALRGSGWPALGLRRPESWGRAFAVAALATLALLVLGYVLRPPVEALTGVAPDLERFDVLRGNVTVLIGGLLVVWTIAAFGEEMLLRGLLMNYLRELMPDREPSDRVAWIVALLLTSIVSGLLHAYQGATGMILTGVIAVGFGLVYLASGRNLWAPILTHGFYDTIGFLFVFLGWDRLIR